MKRPSATVRDVASRAGVSTATVSRALAGDLSISRVSEDTRRKVLDAVAFLDYKTNHVARSLKTRSTRTIAILAPELANDFFMELAEAMEKELGASGYMLLVSSSSNNVEEEARRLRYLSERLVDGIVVIPVAGRGEHLQAIADRGTPVVLVDRLVEGASLDAVLADNEGGAYGATRALIADGHTRFAFVGGDLGLTSASERLDGWIRALEEDSLFSGDRLLGGMAIEDGYRHMDELLRRDDPPAALFAVNLLVHLGLERRLMEEGRGSSGRALAADSLFDPAVFSRFAVASFDETPYSPFMPACRYAVAQPAAEMGAAAARLILERIGRTGTQTEPPKVIRLPTTLIRHQRG